MRVLEVRLDDSSLLESHLQKSGLVITYEKDNRESYTTARQTTHHNKFLLTFTYDTKEDKEKILDHLRNVKSLSPGNTIEIREFNINQAFI